MEVTERQRQAALPGLLNSAYVKWREIQTPVQPGVITYAISSVEFPDILASEKQQLTVSVSSQTKH